MALEADRAGRKLGTLNSTVPMIFCSGCRSSARGLDQLRDDLSCTPVALAPQLATRLETSIGFSLGFPADFIAQTTPWVLGGAAP
jgi:hypothetical protein